jgi:D-amino-acid dehydrogenase
MSERRCCIIGGGVIGAACAYYLRKAGWAVAVVDKRGFGSQCSHANCGLVCPSHVLPLAAPGAVTATLKTFFRKDSPFSVAVRFDPALWAWLAKFALRCNEKDMLAAASGIKALLDSARSLFDELLASESIDCEWETKGLLFAYRDRAPFEHYAATNELLTGKFGRPARRLESAELAALEPALRPGLAGGWLYESDAHLRPDKLMSEWKKILVREGVEIRERCEFTGFRTEGSRIAAAQTDAGEIPAEAFVLATGAWTPLVARELGFSIPIQPGKGYSITMPRPKICPKHPLIFEETRVAVTPFVSGYRLGSTMEFAGYDGTLNRRRLALLKSGADPYLHEPYCEPVQEEWFGWRPMTYDGLPVIDRSPRQPNLLVAAGHSMLGLSMAPATGKLVAELLSETKPHLDPGPYSLGRF